MAWRGILWRVVVLLLSPVGFMWVVGFLGATCFKEGIATPGAPTTIGVLLLVFMFAWFCGALSLFRARDRRRWLGKASRIALYILSGVGLILTTLFFIQGLLWGWPCRGM